jgi:hypothetical protein
LGPIGVEVETEGIEMDWYIRATFHLVSNVLEM